jgi:PTH1 family peptidyl-tRNA hydrolase
MGFLAVDLLAEKYNIDVNKIKFKALVGEGRIAGQKVLLVKPQTYMNLSGEAVRQAMDFYKIDPEELIVIYDDIDIPTGTFRIRKKGSPGTHNGMRNIFQHIQTNDFPRIRVGIGSGKKDNLAGYVTGGISKSEQELLADVLKNSADAAACIIEKGIDKAMNEYNVRPNKEKKEKKAVEEKETKND